MELALTSRALIACRLSPNQKADIVELIKEYQPRKVTLAIGDGVNDLSMLNSAHVAVSLSGNKKNIGQDGGNYALRTSDYSIGQFRHLKTLLFYHGREGYRRNSYLIYYIIYKNLVLNFGLVLYGLQTGFSG